MEATAREAHPHPKQAHDKSLAWWFCFLRFDYFPPNFPLGPAAHTWVGWSRIPPRQFRNTIIIRPFLSNFPSSYPVLSAALRREQAGKSANQFSPPLWLCESISFIIFCQLHDGWNKLHKERGKNRTIKKQISPLFSHLSKPTNISIQRSDSSHRTMATIFTLRWYVKGFFVFVRGSFLLCRLRLRYEWGDG